ncbi:hypothetical protein Dimus_036571 [Dionaea muscipula]
MLPDLSAHGLVNGFPTYYGGNERASHDRDPDFDSADSLSGYYILSSDAGEEDVQEDCDFSDEVLRYINQILMEEDVEDKGCMLQESLELQAAEKSLYEAIGEKYPPPSSSSPLALDTNPSFIPHNILDLDPPYHGFPVNYYWHPSDDIDSGLWVDPSWAHGGCFDVVVGNLEHGIFPNSSPNSSNTSTVADGLVESPVSILQTPDHLLYNGLHSASLFIQAVEDASKFLPLPRGDHSIHRGNENGNGNRLPEELLRKYQEAESSIGLTGRKHSFPDPESLELEEERSSKQAAIYPESTIRSDMFDMILLCHPGDKKSAYLTLREALQSAANKSTKAAASGGKGRGKKQTAKKEVVDLRTLLINCAQAAAADDRRMAYELLQKIRQHSSPFGDGNQRLAHCFANGLEVRLAGTGSQIYRSLVSTRTSASDVLKAYHLYLAACPFRKFSNFYSNRTIVKLTEKASRIHIIDFGILYGFQWPSFIQRQSRKPGGAPRVRITGIDFPQPGFRPAERVEETGCRLSNYAQDFKVPFEYNAIAKKWETIQLEDLKLEEGEVLIVNSIYRMKNLPDETMAAESSRNAVLSLIRKINPDIFIHGVVNGAYNAPFFVTRFREALFHFSSHFDMLETIVPRECNERMLIERDLLGREALNVVACEGWERVERPETYKQWQVRTMKAGFKQLPLDPEIKDKVIKRGRSSYHKDFMIDEDSQWLLQGWKGRIIYALSTWKPA